MSILRGQLSSEEDLPTLKSLALNKLLNELEDYLDTVCYDRSPLNFSNAKTFMTAI